MSSQSLCLPEMVQRVTYQRSPKFRLLEKTNLFSLLYTCTQVCDYQASSAGLSLLCLGLRLFVLFFFFFFFLSFYFFLVVVGEKCLVSVEFVKTESFLLYSVVRRAAKNELTQVQHCLLPTYVLDHEA